jgi:hypothetical protein
MPYYISAYAADGSRILGNLDGQASIRARRPERTAAWKELGTTIRASPRVAYWQLETADERPLLKKLNPNHKEI